ncbi:MAG TPA: hypothetical protein VK674_02470 [Candidatus Limnocylindria bacterium]|nr:hypothetical protein [Candidatus Limnocylindria bacterium]
MGNFLQTNPEALPRRLLMVSLGCIVAVGFGIVRHDSTPDASAESDAALTFPVTCLEGQVRASYHNPSSGIGALLDGDGADKTFVAVRCAETDRDPIIGQAGEASSPGYENVTVPLTVVVDGPQPCEVLESYILFTNGAHIASLSMASAE